MLNIFINDLTRGSSAPSLSSLKIPSSVGVLICLRIRGSKEGSELAVWAIHMSLNKSKSQVLHLDCNNLMQHYKFGEKWLESCLKKKVLGVLVAG